MRCMVDVCITYAEVIVEIRSVSCVCVAGFDVGEAVDSGWMGCWTLALAMLMTRTW